MSTVARHCVVRGRVQGVWFRGTTKDRADARGVAGWARNCDDGTVEVWLEGDADAVAWVERFLHEGPRGADVESVDGSDAEPGGLSGFETR